MSWWPVVVGAVVTAALVPLTIRFLRARRVLDVPNQRSSHVIPTPRGAGLAQIPGFAVVLLLAGSAPVAAWLVPLGFSLLGALDDLRSLGAPRRLALQIVVGVLGSLVVVGELDGLARHLPEFLIGAVILATLIYAVNATNFMDGINGISVAHGVVFSLAYGMILWSAGAEQWLVAPAALLAVSIAVMPWNWGKQARVFLGDSGSYLLGASTGLLMAATWGLGVSLVVAVAPFAIYTIDTAATLISRALRRQPLMTAHREHVYQRLVQQGWSHPRTAVTVALFSSMTAGAGLLVQARVIPTLAGVAAIALLCLSYLLLPAITRGRSAQTRSVDLAGGS